MSKWHIWWLEVLGTPPSEELVAATEGLTARDMRRARRLVRRGEAAEDVVVARAALALACECQRRRDRSDRWLVRPASLVMGLAGGGAAVAALARSDYLAGTAIAVIAVYVFYFGFLTAFREERNAKVAERLNRDVLRCAREPDTSAGTRTLAYVHPLITVLLCCVQTVLFMPIFGIATLLMKGEAISTKHIVTAGLNEPFVIVVALSAAVGTRMYNQKKPRRRSTDRRHRTALNVERD